MTDAALVRPHSERPSWGQVLRRSTVVTVLTAVALWVAAWLLPGLTIDRPVDALLAGLVIGVLNAIVWPALAVVIVPISVLTLGLGAIAIDALVVSWLLDMLPGINVEDFWTALAVVLWLAFVTTVVTTLTAIDDDAWFDQTTARRAKRRHGSSIVTDVPGVVFVQLDGVARRVLARALSSGDVPTLHRWIRDGSHEVTGWETGWSSQTGVSQCGILHGTVADMPAFRWMDKSTGRIVVSNRRSSAAAIEEAHSDGQGLLARHGASYGNLFSGDAERAVLTMSGAGRRKEGRVGAGYFGYFSRPQQAARTLLAVVVEIARERRAASRQRRREVEPRVPRGWTYALLRSFTTVVSRDVCVQGVINDMCEGRAAIYVDLLGYDEVSHHSGPERADTLAVLRDLDHQVHRIERTIRFTPRPYRIVVLSDHGQTQGATFVDRTGETLAALVARLCGSALSGDDDAESGRTESTAWLRHAGARDGKETAPAGSTPVVLGSGSLGLIYLPVAPHRLSLEEIDAVHPDLVAGLVANPEIGFVLVRSAAGGSLVLGRSGCRHLGTGEVTGDDPLAPFGPSAVAQVSETDGYSTVADLMVNSRYDPVLDEVAAFEEQVGSHGGLGGPQTQPFLLHPTDLAPPAEPILGSPALHRVLKGWLADLGHDVTTPWREAAPSEPAPEPAPGPH